MKPNITTLEEDVAHIRTEIAAAYNAHRDATDRLWDAERHLTEAKRRET